MMTGAPVTTGRTDPTTRPDVRHVGAGAVDLDGRAVHHHVLHADGLVGGEPLGVRREVAHAADGTGATVAGSKTATSAHAPGRR